MVSYITETETNAATVSTSASGAGTVKATKLTQVEFASLSAAGYVLVASAPVGQDIPFQAYQSAGTAGALATPAAAVNFNPGVIKVLEVGN